MTVFLLVLLGLVAVALWVRLGWVEQKLDRMEPRLDWLEWSLRERAGHGETQASKAEPQADVVGEDIADEAQAVTQFAESLPEPGVESLAKAESASLIPAMRDVGQVAPAFPAEPNTVSVQPASEGADVSLAETESGYRGRRFDFEDLFGRLLPIWAGGVALAVAGLFLVRYSIEQGLLGPGVRTALGFLFGTGLIAAAEVAFRQERRIADPRVRQALAGAGLATLYASFYMAGSLYGLIGPGLAFIGLAAVTAGSIALSFRFGLPSAILGLVGGFAAPALVGGDEANLPLLALYLALVTGGLSYAGNRQGRSWLGLAALAGGLGWGVLMLLGGVAGKTDILALGGYIVLLGAVVPAFVGGPAAPPLLRAAIAAIAALQMAALVSLAGYEPMAWWLYLLLAAALAFFAWREPRLREASGFAAVLGLWMLGMWPTPSPAGFAAVEAGLAVVFALVPLAHAWRGTERASDVAQLVVVPLGLAALAIIQFHYDLGENGRASLAFAFALIPACASALRWPTSGERVGAAALFPLAAAALGMTAAGWMLVPLWAAPIPPAVATATILGLAFNRAQVGLSAQAWAGFGAIVVAFAIGWGSGAEISRLVEWHDWAFDMETALRWLALLAPVLLFALRPAATPSRMTGEMLASVLFYGLVAQFLPGAALSWFMAATAVALAMLPSARLPAAFAALGISAAWAIQPLAGWSMHAAQSLVGDAMLVADSLAWREIGLRIVPPIVVLGLLSSARCGTDEAARVALRIALGGLVLIAVHLCYKQTFAIVTPEQFVALGFAERTGWQAALLCGAVALHRFADGRGMWRTASGALACASLAHFAFYSLALHNPLLVAQAVGPWPVANLLLASFGIALGCLALLRHATRAGAHVTHTLCDAASMGLIALGGLMLLRQGFAGSILLDPPVGGTEDLLRSLLGILLAIGFLAWGAWRDSRAWRIGSLVLALLAVLKVFLLDAAGLDGLARVASFMALGFSLIGIGWFYTRQLSRPREPEHGGNAVDVPAS